MWLKVVATILVLPFSAQTSMQQQSLSGVKLLIVTKLAHAFFEVA
jgi:hypothetical protein